jgi:hypothetical protein
MPNYNLTLDNFQISEARSLLDDTDYLSFTLQIGLATPQTLVKSMGSIGKGTHTVGLSFANVSLGVTDFVTLSYLIVNAGQSPRVTVETTLENVGALFSSGVAPGFPLPQAFRSALQTDSDWLAAELKGVFHLNCDGAVAAERTGFMINDLLARPGGLPFKQSTAHPGNDSATGCGGNSSYTVNWHVEQVGAIVPDVAGEQPGTAETKIRAAGLVPHPLGTGKLVASQTPAGGTPVPLGSGVTLVLGNVVS